MLLLFFFVFFFFFLFCFLVLFLFIYFLFLFLSVRTISFNKMGAPPDVNQEEMVTSFLQNNSGSHDIGFK